jgi:hypothetical protein
MMQHTIRSAEDLVAYITDCTLATVASLKMKRSASACETKRQIAIAQTALEKGRQLGVDFSKTRAQSVIETYQCKVELWADQFAPEPKAKAPGRRA